MAKSPEVVTSSLGKNRVINGGGHFWQRMPQGCGASRTHTMTASAIFAGATSTAPYVNIGTAVIGPGISGTASVTAVNRGTGDITINQTITGTGTFYFGVADAKFIADRFRIRHTSVLSSNMIYCLPGTKQDGSLGSIKLVAPTAITSSIAKVDIEHIFEGYTTREFLTNSFNLTFWVKSSAAGIYSVMLTNSNGSYGVYRVQFTVAAANTYQKVTVKLPTIRSVDAYSYYKSNGVKIVFTAYRGSAAQGGTNNSWSNTGDFGPSGHANPFANPNGSFEVADICVSESEEFTLSGNTIAGELANCRRFFEKSYAVDIIPGTIGNSGSYNLRTTVVNHYQTIEYSVPKFNSSGATIYSSNTGTPGQVYDASVPADKQANILVESENRFSYAIPTSVAGNAVYTHWTMAAE